ncbi:hypothetical protein ACQEVM_38270 [Streptomyces sp. CA-243310]|uniref:hypothetical protein n=1 Tax=Streptomyces sp. CA-243310 TaxID=3240056 RepID=UPI003D94863D
MSDEDVMSDTFVFLREEFLIDGAWDGLDLDAPLRQLRAEVGAGGSTVSEAAFVALGATTPVLSSVISEQCEAIRVRVRAKTEVWEATLDLARQEVTFVCETTGECTTLPVRPERGDRSAGSFTLELMGIPAVETPSGSVTIDCVMALHYLQQVHAPQRTFGAVNPQDMSVTLEVCLGALDENGARLKAQAKSSRSRATRDSTAQRKANEQRLAYGLPTSFDFDMEEETLSKAADGYVAEVLRIVRELEHHHGVQAGRDKEVAGGWQAVSAAASTADRLQQAQAARYESRGLARQALARAEEAARPRTHCSECEQQLRGLSGPGPVCPQCRQPDLELPARQAHRAEAVAKAKTALAASEAAIAGGNTTAQQAVTTRQKAEQEAQRLIGRAAAYRAQEITPREAARAQASAGEREARAKLAALKERRKELARIRELEQLAAASSQRAEDAEKAWAAAEGDAQEHRKQTAKQLSQIYAELVIPMAPDRIRSAVIDPKTFTPRINNRTMRQLARSAGLVSVAHVAYHLMLLEAARTMPLVRLAPLQWLDSPLDGLGGGAAGERLATAVLDICTATAGGGGQLILTTPQALSRSVPGMAVTEHDSSRPTIPHARPESDAL